ncbi:hypothetical protein AKH00_05875 [Microbacterium sp. GCS4]|nr:hypothetical protein AKH00_05875 [Microbacterium sp. GCS4]
MKRRARASVLITVASVVTALVIAVASVGVLVVIGVGNFQVTQATDEAPVDVVASVDTGSVQKALSVDVHTRPLSTLEVPAAQFGVGIVTGVAPATVDDGGVLLSVSEQPVIVIQGALPAYRSLAQGAEGGDVAQLQEYLRRTGLTIDDKAGVFGPSTAGALFEHYKSRNFAVVTADGARAENWRDTGLPLSRYVFAASTPVIVGSDCGRVGQTADSLKCVLNSQSTAVAVASDAEQDLTGLALTLSTSSGAEIPATIGDPTTPILDVSDEEETDASDSRRWYVLDGIPAEAQQDLRETAEVIVESSPEDALRVPSTAIRETADGATFIREPSSGSGKGRDRPVEVTLCAGGYCAVTGEGIVDGMKVILLG